MSKGLEALRRIKMLEISCDRESYDLRPITKVCKEDLSTIEKELKALDIIKKYPHLIKIILDATITYGKNNIEEYDLLRGVLQCQDKD